MDTKGLQKEFINWCKANKKSPKSEQETKQLFVSFMKEKHPEEYKQAMENQQKQQQQQAQKAAHGTKLNYFRTLKNQCPEGEELVYYKKGGQVSCGCKKKKEEGGVIADDENDWKKKFKARKAQAGSKMLDLVESRKGRKKAADEAEKRKLAEERRKKTWGATSMVIGKDIQPGSGNDTKNQGESAAQYYLGLGYHKQGSDQKPAQKKPKSACGSKIVKKDKKGSAIEEFKKAKCGSKLKKHLQGGSLNRIPFIRLEL